MHISWGKDRRYKFVGNGEFSRWTPPAMPAVFAVTYKQDPLEKPKSHTVLFFGHAADLAAELATLNCRIHELWAERGGNLDELYVFVHPMPESTRAQREGVQWQLISEYWPAGNQ